MSLDIFTGFGVDPGLVHTGMVALTIDISYRTLLVRYEPIPGLDKFAARKFILSNTRPSAETRCWIEEYRPRKNLKQDTRMIEGTKTLHDYLPGSQLLNNTGSRKVVKPQLLRLLGLTGFTATHHQDLEAAARILVFGMLKDDELNKVLTKIVTDYLINRPWTLRS